MALVGTLRGSFDLITGYNSNKTMTERHWLRRVLFLETVAGVPGMVGRPIFAWFTWDLQIDGLTAPRWKLETVMSEFQG